MPENCTDSWHDGLFFVGFYPKRFMYFSGLIAARAWSGCLSYPFRFATRSRLSTLGHKRPSRARPDFREITPEIMSLFQGINFVRARSGQQTNQTPSINVKYEIRSNVGDIQSGRQRNHFGSRWRAVSFWPRHKGIQEGDQSNDR